MINNAIAGGWQGVFELKENKTNFTKNQSFTDSLMEKEANMERIFKEIDREHGINTSNGFTQIG
jgi:hypothetical protein